jgi:hypothetical protein
MRESIDMRGQITLRLTDAEGRVVHEELRKNQIVRSGRQLVAQLFAGALVGPQPTRVTHIAVGTSATPTDDGQTALGAERTPRKPLTDITYTDTDEPQPGGGTVKRVKASMKAVYEFDEANGSDPLREAGLFTADAAGTMYNRVVFDPVIKNNTFKLTLLWDIVF